MRNSWKGLGLALLFLIILPACGSDGAPFEMATATTMVVSDVETNSVHFQVNPDESTGSGVLTAQILKDFLDRRELVIENFSMEVDFASIGPVKIHLNPNMESTAIVYRLNSNNQPFGTHMMLLNLIVETPDQNLTYDNVMLSGDTATLQLTQPLPILGFLFNNQAKQLQTLALSVIIPANLITSNEDPLLTFE